jgi:hypothetical protein
MPVAKRESKAGISPNYSPFASPHVIARNVSISKKCSPSYMLSFSDMNSDNMEDSFHIAIIPT